MLNLLSSMDSTNDINLCSDCSYAKLQSKLSPLCPVQTPSNIDKVCTVVLKWLPVVIPSCWGDMLVVFLVGWVYLGYGHKLWLQKTYKITWWCMVMLFKIIRGATHVGLPGAACAKSKCHKNTNQTASNSIKLLCDMFGAAPQWHATMLNQSTIIHAWHHVLALVNLVTWM